MTMNWWYSQDQERWQGPHASREDAVNEGRDNYGEGETFYVCQARQGEYDLRISADRILELIDDHNEENVDGEDSGNVFDGVTRAQEKDLEDLMEKTIRAWAVANRFSLTAWSFEEQTPAEEIEPVETE